MTDEPCGGGKSVLQREQKGRSGIEHILQWRDETGKLNMLQVAILYGLTAEIKLILSKTDGYFLVDSIYASSSRPSTSGRSFDNVNEILNPPLHLAIYLGREDIVELLLNKGLDLTTPAVITGEIMQIKDKMADAFQTVSAKATKRNLADIRAKLAAVLGTRKRKCDIKDGENQFYNIEYPVQNKMQAYTPLQLAILTKRTNITIRLLDTPLEQIRKECVVHGAAFNQVILRGIFRNFVRSGVPMLHKACMCCGVPELELIVANYPEEINKLWRGQLPVHTATECGNLPCVSFLWTYAYPPQFPFGDDAFEKCLESWSNSPILGNVMEVGQIIAEKAVDLLQCSAFRSQYMLMVHTYLIIHLIWVSQFLPSDRIAVVEKLLRRPIVAPQSVEVTVQRLLSMVLSQIKRVDAVQEKVNFRNTCFDIVMSVGDIFFDERPLPKFILEALHQLLTCHFDPNVWETGVEIAHLRRFLYDRQVNLDPQDRVSLISALCQHGWDVDRLLPFNLFATEASCPLIWLLRQDDLTGLPGRTFVNCKSFRVLCHFMQVPSLSTAAATLTNMYTSSGETDDNLDHALRIIQVVITTPRSLQHLCKLAILLHVRQRGCLVPKLEDLSRPIQTYLIYEEF